MCRLVFCVFLFSVLRAIEIRADQTPKRPSSIFRPGDFFDPFREKKIQDNQVSASVQPQTKAVYGGQSAIFNPFKEASVLVGYPRNIGKVSGNAEQFNAQLWNPNEFFTNFERYGVQPVPASKAQPRAFDAIVAFEPRKQYPVVNSQKLLVPRAQGLKLSYKNPTGATPGGERGAAHAEASHVVEQESKASDFNSHPFFNAVSKSAGAGQQHVKGHHASHGDKEVTDYKSDHNHDKADHKKYDDYHKGSHHKEKGGNINKHHDEGSHYKNHHEGKKSQKSAKFGEKKGHKRGHKTKGYHNKFHRDEYHREHRFYDDYNKEGYHEKHGDGHSHYKKEKGGHKKGGSHQSGHSDKDHGKKDYSDEEKYVEDHKGFDKENGKKKYHKHHSDHGKRDGSVKGKEYGYSDHH